MSIDVGHIIAYLLTGIFLLTSTLYLGRQPKNTFSALVLVEISGKLPCVWSRVLLIGSRLSNSTSVRQQKTSFTLIRLYCASWRPSPLLVAFLASVNGLHYWLVIRWFRACSTSMHIFTCINLCCSVKWKSRPWEESCITQPCFLSQVAYVVFWRQLIRMILLWHRICIVLISS